MKNIILAFILAVTGIAHAQDGVTLTITTDNVPNNEGKVVYGLYDEASFMKAAPLMSAEATITDGKTEVTFENVTTGTYAIASYHDRNGNDQMDFEPNGMPTEDYGVSNNPAPAMGPPIWSDAKFEVGTEDMIMNIRF